ncbi:Fungal Zn(2)-Cys(6) binuclear cluster domain [Geosmithia morbida]|uniref:Fungal Zn(2)-Cys(6) binuclear cluster domain n=1 Tax=Geosmithia morbida TaxID=1094350 RepID=A0A9P4Z0C5_9HYPO|nr:Fungal Zn(2)-Cys(6) binuclear cluster domain [Geosmithia morbida]KAF4126368.1 Fungal Zn(2)-Cys(6) binuclear cluster domain [Geosmithia morbida]
MSTTTTATTTTPAPSATVTASAAGTKSRRSHRKSRNGCIECKRRHIRCDEGRPACTNCTIAERNCSFPVPPAAPAVHTPGTSTLEVPSSHHHSHSHRHHHGHSPARSSSSFGSRDAASDDFFPRPPPMTASAPIAGLHHHFHHQSYHALHPQQHQPQHQHHQPQQHQQHQQQHQQQPLPGLSSTQQQQSLPSFNESFANAGPAATVPPPPPPPPPPPSSSSRAGSGSAGSAAGGAPFPGGSVTSVFTPQHLVLLHHLEADMGSDILGQGQTSTVLDVAIRRVAECPYLIDELLAFSALHLAHRAPETAGSFAHQSTELQTRGLSYFAREVEYLGAADSHVAGPRFLYATLLSLHSLAETLVYLRADLDLFVDRFIECIHLHRGILHTLRFQFDLLLRSELSPIISIAQLQTSGGPLLGHECKPLAALVESSAAAAAGLAELPASEAACCRDVVNLLQWAFDLSAQLPSRDFPHAVSGFIVLVPHDFVAVLRARRPVALVILAYFGVLMHRTRRYWICGDNGALMIGTVARQLGPRTP